VKLRARLGCLILAIICGLGAGSIRADEPGTAPPAGNAAPAPITDPAQVRAHYLQVLGRPEFQEVEEPGINGHLKELLSQWFTRLGLRIGHFKYASRMPAFESLLMTLLVILAVTGLLYVMVRLTRRRGGMEEEWTGATPGQRVFRPPESYDAEIAQAIRDGDWHTAWLAAWRQFLSRLENRRLVEPDRTRTNREYLGQLHDKALPASALTLLTGMVDAYDRFIYGRKAIDETDWNLFHRQLGEAALLLHLDGKARPNHPETS